MKKKLCLCYCPAVIETDDSADHHFPNTGPLSTSKIIGKEPEEKALLSAEKSSILKHNNKSINKLPSRKISPYKYFPRLLKTTLFQDHVKKIQQLEYELKSNGWNKDEKCVKKLEGHGSRKPEMKAEEVNQMPQETVISVSHEPPKSLASKRQSSKPSNQTKPNTNIASVSCNGPKKESCSLLFLIFFALLMTIFLGKFWAIMLILSWLCSTPHRGQFFLQRENTMKSTETKSKVITESLKSLT